jgi:hypothetical protein
MDELEEILNLAVGVVCLLIGAVAAGFLWGWLVGVVVFFVGLGIGILAS